MVDRNSLRLVISEENPVLRHALAAYFSGQVDIEVVGQGAESSEILALCEQEHPDVILVDSNLKPMPIMTFIERLCDDSPDIRVVVFASILDETPSSHYEEAGAAATVIQGILASDLLSVIQSVHEMN
jgi:DNA-binding NarL/FixJ family response regulator